MALDPTTDFIAHFIGLFRIAPEAGRFHQDYERILSDPEGDAERGPLDLGIAAIRVSHEPEGFDPKLAYAAPDHDYTYQSVLLDQPEWGGPGKSLTFQIGLALPSFSGPALGAPSQSGVARVDIEIPPPGSLISVTVQQAYLSDDDVFGFIEGHGFEPVAPLADALRYLADVAEDLNPVEVDLAHGAADWMAMAREALDSLPEAGSSTDGPLSVVTLRGESAYGIQVNGVSLEEMPLWTDHLPAHLKAEDVPLPLPAKDEAETSEDRGSEDTPHDFSHDFGPGVAPQPSQDHGIITGANVAVNNVSLVSNWLDAPVIAVAGDIVRLDAISQVNLLVEHDWAPGIGGSASTAVNAAELAKTSSEPEENTDMGGAKGAPPAWSVVRVEGDVVQINWVDQFTFATDNDRATVTVSGRDSKIGLGENEIVNEAFFWELGWAYDLIVVGGDLIDLSVIKQTNVLLDSDTVHGGDAGAGDGDPLATAGPAARSGDGATAGVAVSGQGVPASLTKATADTEDGGAEAAMPEPAPAAPDPAGSSSADNLLWNQARIETIGQDIHERLDDAFADTIRKLADGAEDVEAKVAAHPTFEGLDLLKVLYISGDFVTVDKITQTNILGDADQVRLAREAFEKDLGEQLAVTTGSNLAANIAEIVDVGMDSTLMAGGDVYSDALIHQAELIDDAKTAQGDIAALATEAVAFLADDMIAAMPSAAEISARADAAIAETAGQSDVMQTVLA